MRSVGVDDEWAGLLGRAQAGDERAFAAIWRHHQPGLLRYLEIVAGRHVAEDLAAETWVSVVRSLPRFRGGESGFKSFLFTTARSRVVDGARRAKARPQVASDIDTLADLAPAAEPAEAGAALEQREATKAALDLIARLPEGQAEVVALRVVGGLDNSEVARITGKRSGAVRVAYSRGIAALAAMVGDRDGVTDAHLRAFR